jgi:hypothetical protein
VVVVYAVGYDMNMTASRETRRAERLIIIAYSGYVGFPLCGVFYKRVGVLKCMSFLFFLKEYKMKIHICITIIMFFGCSLQVAANEALDRNTMNKDIQDSLATISKSYGSNYERKKKMESESDRLIKKYGIELIDPMRQLAIEERFDNGRFALKTLVRLGKSDSVKRAFLDIAKNADIRLISIYALAKIDRAAARDAAIDAMNAKDNPYLKEPIVSMLGVIGDPNTLLILRNIEHDRKFDKRYRKSFCQAREYLEHRLNLPNEKARKSWDDQAYVYWYVLKEGDVPYYITEKAICREAAKLMAECGHRFSLDFLRYHLSRKDPLAAAVIGIQGEEDAVGDLEMYMNENSDQRSTFKDMCRWAHKSIKEKDKPKAIRDRRGKPIEQTD